MATADEKAMEGDRGGFEVEEAASPSVRYLWEGKATDAVLEFLRTTRVGCVGTGRVPPEDRGEDESCSGPYADGLGSVKDQQIKKLSTQLSI